MRGGYARRSRRESCQAQRALPARFSEQNLLIRASVRFCHDDWKSGSASTNVDDVDLEEGDPAVDDPLSLPPLLPPSSFDFSFSNSTTRSCTRSLTNSNSRTLVRSWASSSSIGVGVWFWLCSELMSVEDEAEDGVGVDWEDAESWAAKLYDG